MGQSKPSKTRGKRMLNVVNVKSRISSDNEDLLKKEFDRIQEGSVSQLTILVSPYSKHLSYAG